MVASPISAGVEGTQSATGVNTAIPNTSRWSSLINPQSSSSTTTAWHTVTLDGRALSTPLGLPLTLPSLPLALAIASKWDAQKIYLQLAQMKLMTLYCTAIQVARDPTAHQLDVMQYLGNDTSWSCIVDNQRCGRDCSPPSQQIYLTTAKS